MTGDPGKVLISNKHEQNPSGKAWTSLYMDGTAVNFFSWLTTHEAGTWEPNYTPGVDFLDHDFLKSKKFNYLMRGQTLLWGH